MALTVFILLLHGSASAHERASRAVAQTDPRAAARQRFQNGVAAFNDRRFAEAAEEFDAAYRLSPAFAVLYNIGQVNVALGRSVEAVDAFEKYLHQGASAIPAQRRHEVEAEIEKQQARIGTVAIRTTPESAEVRIDGKLVGKTPFAQPLRVTAGRHTIEAMLADHPTQIREVEVAGKTRLEVAFTLETPPAPVAAPSMPAPTLSAPLAPPPAPAPVASVTPVDRATPVVSGSGSSFNWLRAIGYATAIGGLVAVTAGGLIALDGANKASDAKTALGTAKTVDEWLKAKPSFDQGKSRNERGWTIAAIGGAVVVGGIVLIATAPDSKSESVALAPWLAAGSGGLVIEGVW